MGYSASIDIEIEKKLSSNFFKKELFENGWDYNDNGFLFYIPLHDNDFEWEKVPFTQNKEKVLKEVYQKLLLEENIGLVIVYKNENIGGQLIYFPKSNLISFIININRVKKSNGQTDFSWYQRKLENVFENYIIKSIKHIEL